MRNKHAITLEHLRIGALKGVILDADGSVLYDLYDEFDIAPKTISFALATDTTNVRQKCIDVLAHFKGEFMTGVRCSVLARVLREAHRPPQGREGG